jgi:hypothetical protein
MSYVMLTWVGDSLIGHGLGWFSPGEEPSLQSAELVANSNAGIGTPPPVQFEPMGGDRAECRCE